MTQPYISRSSIGILKEPLCHQRQKTAQVIRERSQEEGIVKTRLSGTCTNIKGMGLEMMCKCGGLFMYPEITARYEKHSTVVFMSQYFSVTI